MASADFRRGMGKEKGMSQGIEQAVRSKYGSVATSSLSGDDVGVRAVAGRGKGRPRLEPVFVRRKAAGR